jgi:hypothetical protein
MSRLDDYHKKAIDLVVQEIKNYETASREIRNQIKVARKNYMGKFDQPRTSTGRVKTFIPLTQWEVDTIVPKIYVNDKAVTVIPRNEDSIRKSFIADAVLKYQIRTTNFPMSFRNSLYDLGIDGTTVWAIGWNFQKETVTREDFSKSMRALNKLKSLMSRKKKPTSQEVNVLVDQISFKQIDLLNCFIDPTADSIQEAQSFIFRNVTELEKLKQNPIYFDSKNEVKGYTSESFDTYDSRATNNAHTGTESQRYEQPMASTHERWGLFPLAWVTGKQEDEKRMVTGVITIADKDNTRPILLRIELNPFNHRKKPFEECWFQKKKGLWYGIGIGMKMRQLQKYLNKAVNRRIENEDVLHAGLFKIKRGSGLSTRNIISTPGGVIEVDQMSDIEQLDVRDISQLSNGTIDMIQSFVERINGASEIATGTSADRSATTSMIKDRNADTRFASVRGYINDFLLRFFTQVVAVNQQFLDKKFTLRLTGDQADFEQLDGMLGLSDDVRAKAPNYRFLDVNPEDQEGDFDLEVDIDQSIPMNKAENAERILRAIDLGSKLGLQRDYDKLYDTYLDFIGLQGAKYKLRQNPQQQIPVMMANNPIQSPAGQMSPQGELNQMISASPSIPAPTGGATTPFPSNL